MKTKLNGFLTLILALLVQVTFAQEKTVTGKVSDASGPLPGVTVLIKGTKTGSQTDFDGNYSIRVNTGAVLQFSFVGMQTAERTVGASNVINVTMQESAEALEEVVVTANLGYFTRDTKKLTSSISTVTSDDLVKQSPSLTINNALQGQAAGVQVTAANGKPGANAFVSVRGSVSITGGSSSATYVVDGAFVSSTDISSLSSSDVESVTILKDGAAAALYGVRGANGVIVITTKKGKGAKTKFEFNSTVGFTQKLKDPFRMMNAEEKIRYEGLIGGGSSLTKTPAEIELMKSYNHDWQDTLLQDGLIQNHNFSYSGSDGKFSNYFSMGVDENTGIIKNLDGYNRINGRYNSEYQATDFVKFGFNVGGSYQKLNEPRDRNNTQNPFRGIYDYNAYEPVFSRDANGVILLDATGKPVYNPTLAGFPIAEAILNNTEQQRYFRLFGRPYLEITPIKNLVFTSKINTNYERYQRESFVKPFSFLDNIVGDANARGSKTDNGHDALEYQWTNSIQYLFDLGSKHNIDVILMHEYFKSNFRSYSLARKGFISGDLPTGGSASTTVPFTSHTENATISYFGNINYDFSDKYLFSVYGRYDGASVLGANNKWEFAKGASLGWALSEEEFMKDVKWVNNLKLRGSYGELNTTGGIGNYSAQSVYSTTSYGGLTGTIITGGLIGNPNLKFEKAIKTEIGLESSLFDNRLRFTTSYFNDKREDFVYSDNSTNGALWGSLINAGDWTAKGVELELKGFAIKNENTNLSFYVNASRINREVNKLNRPDDPENQLLRGLTVTKVGFQPDEFFLTRYVGVNATNGLAEYLTKDGVVTTTFSDNDRVLSGKTPYAKHEGGFGMNFSHKGFDISTDFVFKEGNYTYNYMWWNMNADGSSVNRNQAVDAFDFWTIDNPNATLPSPRTKSNVNSNVVSDRFLQDASYIRLRSLNIGYTLDKKNFSSMPFNQVRIYTQMQNLLTWTNFIGDPEVGIGSGESQTTLLVPGQFALYSYPNVRSMSMGVSINF
jgi:TonB-linked SusC/RagA family outer membrane protein